MKKDCAQIEEKKVWSSPEIEVISIESETLGVPGVGDDYLEYIES
jgi:hypothetical protein